MATRVRPKDELLHEQDFYVWTEVQADLLRARRFDALDLENLIPARSRRDARARAGVGRDQRLENWKLRRALRRPYFLRSTRRESRVR